MGRKEPTDSWTGANEAADADKQPRRELEKMKKSGKENVDQPQPSWAKEGVLPSGWPPWQHAVPLKMRKKESLFFLRHKKLSVQMAVASTLHHSFYAAKAVMLECERRQAFRGFTSSMFLRLMATWTLLTKPLKWWCSYRLTLASILCGYSRSRARRRAVKNGVAFVAGAPTLN